MHPRFHLAAARPQSMPDRHKELDAAIASGDWVNAAKYQDWNPLEDSLVYDVFECPTNHKMILIRQVQWADFMMNDCPMETEILDEVRAKSVREFAEEKLKPMAEEIGPEFDTTKSIHVGPNRWKLFSLLMLSLLFVLASFLTPVTEGIFLLRLCGAFFGLCGFLILLMLVPGFMGLEISPEKLLIRNLFRAKEYRWLHVGQFYNGSDFITFYTPTSSSSEVNWRSGQTDREWKKNYIGGAYRIPSAELCDLLNAYREAALSSKSALKQAS